MNGEEQPRPGKTLGSLAKGFAISAHIAGYIIGPLVVLAGIGYLLDKAFSTSPIILIVSILLAFVVTNILIVKKSSRLVDRHMPDKSEKKQ